MSDEISSQLARQVDEYIERLLVPHDAALEQGLKDAEAAGLPAINVSANEGKLLHLIAKMAQAKRILEIGTLGGYSTAWLARALPNDGKLVTLELDQKHADLARKNLDRAGVGKRVEIRVGSASASLKKMIEQHETAFDLIFIDANKDSYVDYLNLSLQLAHSGSIILADNLIRNGRALEKIPPDENARGAKAYNEAMAANPKLDSIILPIIRSNLDGISISIVK
ncbi:MAG TPA: O-methyltransferase [Anaerolineae bacterium]|nr:O-methyltransferase [Anaerolineae bacterium]